MARPPTSVGWATVSVNMPRPTVDAFNAISEEKKAIVRRAIKKLIEDAVDKHQAGNERAG